MSPASPIVTVFLPHCFSLRINVISFACTNTSLWARQFSSYSCLSLATPFSATCHHPVLFHSELSSGTTSVFLVDYLWTVPLHHRSYSTDPRLTSKFLLCVPELPVLYLHRICDLSGHYPPIWSGSIISYGGWVVDPVLSILLLGLSDLTHGCSLDKIEKLSHDDIKVWVQQWAHHNSSHFVL